MALFQDFENIMHGGLRENTVYLVRGPLGTGKTALCLTLLKEMLARGESCLYLTTELPPKTFLEHAKHGFGFDFEREAKKKQLTFLDAFSWKTGDEQPGALNVSDLTAMSHNLGRVFEDVKEGKRERFFLFFDTVTSLLLYNPPEVVIKFLQVLVARMHTVSDEGLPGFFTLEAGLYDEKIVNTISFFMDGIFETRSVPLNSDYRREFRVLTLKSAIHRTDWLPVKIGPGGFAFPEGALEVKA